ncbi:MAG TPA: NAD-dependent protein deacylase [Gammaproteobacteria bacterium]|nr:NAD-dependent protein deacylase [Gammaproteobacteria bacterium]
MSLPDPMLARDVAVLLRGARRLAFLTGAGISAESGLPTYRGVGGLYNEMTIDEGLPIEEILSGETFARDPALTWKYLFEIERACRGAQPNAAHAIIAGLERTHEVCVITQNVDGFHVAAGSRDVIEIHGRLSELRCTGCAGTSTQRDFDALDLPPRCGRCDGILRPEVVLFGEMLPLRALARYEAALRRGFDLVFAIGTTAGFPYIYEPVAMSAHAGVPTIEINPDRTPLSALVSHRFACGAAAALRAIVDAAVPRPDTPREC